MYTHFVTEYEDPVPALGHAKNIQNCNGTKMGLYLQCGLTNDPKIWK